jgi:GcrA cell cycle regulator
MSRWTGWNDSNTEQCRVWYYVEGLSATTIAARFGVGRGAIVSKMARVFGRLEKSDMTARRVAHRVKGDIALQNRLTAVQRAAQRGSTPKPTPMPPAAETPASARPSGYPEPIPLLSLLWSSCRWPMSVVPPGQSHADMRFCGARKGDGPYCAHHAKLAVQERQPDKRHMRLERFA